MNNDEIGVGNESKFNDLKVTFVNLIELKDFFNQPFKVRTDYQLYELVKSIENNGILVPLLVRKNTIGVGYEIISGHRRKTACEILGIEKVPVIIYDLDDSDAIVTMIDSNLQREYIRISEKAFAYKMKLEVMKSQGKRNDLTSSQLGTKLIQNDSIDRKIILRADERLAKEIGESRNQIARYIRLTKLIPKILDLMDEGKIAFTVGVELSYLTEEEQYELYVVMDSEQCTPSLSQANRMKRMSQIGTLNFDEIYAIMEQEKPNQREQIKIHAQTDFLSETEFQDFLDQIIYKSYYDFGLRPAAEDKLFSISTCYMVGSEQRLSIHAVVSATHPD